VTRALVIGGYGGFGGRLSRRLARMGWEVIVAGRRLAEAEAFCRHSPSCRPARADRGKGISGLLADERPDLVIDASGPFQSADYRLVEECIAAGVSYVDLADAREFVTGIGRHDEAARQAGVVAISGGSSVPALSGAVVRRLAEGMEHISSVEIAISASGRSSVGRSVTSAVLTGIGKPLELWRGGRRETGYGGQELRRECIGISGGPDLGIRSLALADVPDLALLPERLPGRPAVTFRAGTESSLGVVALWLASWPVRWGWAGSIRPLFRFFTAAHRLTASWGSDRSGMIVRLFGLVGGKRVERRWTLVAEQGDGPEIPTLAAAILAERVASGDIAPGAGDAGGLLDLDAFEPLFETLAVSHATTEIEQPPALYAWVLRARFDTLPPAVKAIHGVLRDSGANGRARVERGRHPLARLVARAMRFPDAGEYPLHVHFVEDGGTERWTRDFGGKCFASSLSAAGDSIAERFGPLRFHFALRTDARGLTMEINRWSIFGVRLPLALAPRSPAREWEEGGRFHFDVPVELPLIGPVVRYCGWLEPPAVAAT
jgi:hypothetical protein